MGNRSGGRSASPAGLVERYRGVVFSVLAVGVMLTGAVAGAAVLDGGGASDVLAIGAQSDVTEIDSCTVIDEPGHYELAGDVEGDAEACLQIKSDDVFLDGNGHAVRGPGTESGVGILVFNGSRSGYPREGAPLTGVTVQNVEVTDWKRGVQAGVELREGPTVTLRNVTARGNGRGVSLYGGRESALTDVTAANNDRVGVVLWGTANVTADGVAATGNGASGLSFSDGVSGSQFVNVTVAGNDGHGVHFSTGATNNSVARADVRDNDGAGVAFVDSADNRVRNSTVANNTGPGVLADPADGDRVSNVTVVDNEIAYRNGFAGVRYGAVVDGLRVDSGAVATFDRNVSSFDGEATAPEPPRNARTAGPAVNVTLADEAPADARVTVTFPYADEAVGNESTLSVVRYADGDWRPVRDVRVDPANQTVTARAGDSGILIPVYAGGSEPISADGSTFVVNATGDEDVAYGFVVDGRVRTTSATALPAEDDEDLVEERADGTTVVLGSTGEDGGDTFVVTGEIRQFSTQPPNASVRLELDGEDLTDRLVANETNATGEYP